MNIRQRNKRNTASTMGSRKKRSRTDIVVMFFFIILGLLFLFYFNEKHGIFGVRIGLFNDNYSNKKNLINGDGTIYNIGKQREVGGDDSDIIDQPGHTVDKLPKYRDVDREYLNNLINSH